MRKVALLVVLLGTAATLSAAETRWVERTKVDIRAGRGSFHDIVDTVLKGEQVELLKVEDRWASVRTPRAKTGWVYEAALVSKAVQPSESNFLKLIGGDASTSRTAASQGAKGVYAQEYARGKGYDYGIVEWVESHQPTSSDVEAFLKSSGEPAGGRR